MILNNKGFTTVEKINLLERWILFHSYLYYEKNESIVSDNVYDKNAHMLYKAIVKYPKAFKASRYYKFFKDYDGNTGMQLINKIKKSNKLVEMLEFDCNVALENIFEKN